MPNRIRILTLNLWQRYGEWAERRSVLIDGIRAKQPDLVAFAESIKTGEYDQTVDLLGKGFNVAHSSARDTNGMGISIASRWPIQEVQEVDLSDFAHGGISLYSPCRHRRRARSHRLLIVREPFPELAIELRA